ncbi:MAG: hypothetical protein HY869_09710 [Chloroflexi bacterium]|nr:hypothetical protein [Chloroflexota bacterium]
MTDWDMMTENIRNAMQAMDEAQRARQALLEQPTPDKFDAFRAEMQELTEHLTQLQTVLADEESFAVDELADWLSQVFTGHRAEYRHTPRMER